MGKDAFISYSSREYEIALQTKNVLEENGISCWMAPGSIPPGSDYGTEIDGAIRQCSVFVLILSDEAQHSVWVPKELSQAITYRKTILPFHIDTSDVVKPFSFHLSNVQRIEAYEDIAGAYRELVLQAQRVLGQDAAGQVQISQEVKEPGREEQQKHGRESRESGKSTGTDKAAGFLKKAFAFTVHDKKQVKAETRCIKLMLAEVETFQSRMPDGSAGAALDQLKETLRYSDPVSPAEVAEIEASILQISEKMSEAVSAGDQDTVAGLAKEMELRVGDRNRLCKAFK